MKMTGERGEWNNTGGDPRQAECARDVVWTQIQAVSNWGQEVKNLL